MLTTEQEEILENLSEDAEKILKANAEIAHDRVRVQEISQIKIDSFSSFASIPPKEGFAQQFKVEYPQQEPLFYNIYTPELILGVAPSNILDANTKLDAREQSEVTDAYNNLISQTENI